MRMTFTSCVLSVALAVALAGCGGSGSKVEESTSSVAPVESAESKPEASEATPDDTGAKPQVQAATTDGAKPQAEATATESAKPQAEAAPADTTAKPQPEASTTAPPASQELINARDEAQSDMLDIIGEWDSASIQYAQLGATVDELGYYYEEATDRLFMTCDEWLDTIDAMDDSDEAKAYYRKQIQGDRDLYLASMEESYYTALGFVVER